MLLPLPSLTLFAKYWEIPTEKMECEVIICKQRIDVFSRADKLIQCQVLAHVLHN